MAVFLIIASIIAVKCAATQTRLIRSYQNESISSFFDQTANNINVTFGERRRLRIIDDFGAGHERLKAVALISANFGTGHQSICSGAYFKGPKGDNNKYVLTASHCVYDKTKTRTAGTARNPTCPCNGDWLVPIGMFRVEFGVTRGWAAGTNNIVQCLVTDIRVNNHRIAAAPRPIDFIHDYAVLTLGGARCNPTEAFKITKYYSAKQNFRRAGYTGSRVLTVHIHEKLSNKDLKVHLPNEEQRKRLQKHHHLSHGHGGSGDSGGPMFTNKNGRIQAIYTGRNNGNRVSRAIKIRKDVRTNIQNYIQKTDGVSPLFKNCQNTEYKSNECWSNCRSAKPATCFEHTTQTRDFDKYNRKINCGATGSNRWRYLCGVIKDCKTEKDSKKCSSKCHKTKSPGNKDGKCPKGRAVGAHIACLNKKGRYRYVCSKKTVETAHQSVQDLLGYDDMNDEFYDEDNGVEYFKDVDDEYYYDYGYDENEGENYLDDDVEYFKEIYDDE
eukprot:153921_1